MTARPFPWAHLHDVPIPPEKVSFVVAHSPDWRPPEVEPPIYLHDWHELLAQAERSLATRREAYPDWVNRGQISQDHADRDIRAWELIVAEWRWILTGEGEAPGRETHPDRVAAVELMLQRIDEQIKRGNRRHETYRQCHLALALHWHLALHVYGEPTTHRIARETHELRRLRADAMQKGEAA